MKLVVDGWWLAVSSWLLAVGSSSLEEIKWESASQIIVAMVMSPPR